MKKKILLLFSIFWLFNTNIQTNAQCTDCNDLACLITLPCDDNNCNTTNDMATYLAEDQSIVCVPCDGTPVEPPSCDDGDPNTMDSFDPLTCNCINEELICGGMTCNDGCDLTIDMLDEITCECVFTEPTCDDGNPDTEDSFDAENCNCLNEEPIICGGMTCNDGCDLTTDVLNTNKCVCEYTEPTCDDGNPNTIDSFDYLNCECINICDGLTCDDGCDLTIDILDEITCECVFTEPTCDDGNPDTEDSFDAENCNCLNEEPIICGGMTCNDGCDLTTDVLNTDKCKCIYTEPTCDDGNPNTVDSFDFLNCNCINEEIIICDGLTCDDGCDLTTDVLDETTCECVFTEPNCDDDNPDTEDSFDAENCNCINETIIFCEGLSCDDGCGLTTDILYPITCECDYILPDCDDGNPDTEDSFDAENCNCINEGPICDGLTCDDGCDLTTDMLDETTCECVFTEPDCDDGNPDTVDSFDDESCNCINEEPIICGGMTCNDGCDLTTDVLNTDKCICVYTEPTCDDGNPSTVDSFDYLNCNCINEGPICDGLTCDDGCDLTTDSIDPNTCECIFTNPDCDDGDPNTTDSFDATNCECVNEDMGCNITCDDNCDLTTDSVDPNTCECIFTNPTCDDGDPNTTDSFDATACECVNEICDGLECNDGCPLTTDVLDPNTCECTFTNPSCDDGISTTDDSFDENTCTCVNEDNTGICDDFDFEISVECSEDNTRYNLILVFTGGSPGNAGYILTNNITNEITQFSVSGVEIIGPFTNSDGYDYTLSVVDNANCTITLSESGVDCVSTAVELLEFKGRKLESSNEIYWSTASEHNSDYFLLEKSEDGYNFTIVSKIKAAGNSNTIQSYSFNDDEISKGTAYYKLTEVDLNGIKIINSNLVTINRRGQLSIIHLMPVPATNNINIQFYTGNNEDVQIEIYDITGRLIENKTMIVFVGNNTINMDIESYPIGTYFLKMTQKEEMQLTKFLKNR